jgi:cullin-4
MQPLIGAVDEELLSAHVTALLDKGLPSLLEAPPRIRELRLLYGLVGRVGGLGHLKAGLGAYVRRAGTALMVNQDKDKDMVQVRTFYGGVSQHTAWDFRVQIAPD